MKTSEIIEQSLHFFGKDRRPLGKLLSTHDFTGSHYRKWKRNLRPFSSKPFDLSYGIFDDVAESLISKNYSEIDWMWLGDLSWEIRFVLNAGIEKVYDFDKRLAAKCGGTVRILQFYVSEVVPSCVMNPYYMVHNPKENYWEFGPLSMTAEETDFADQIKKFLRASGFAFLPPATSLRTFAGLYSDCNDGNATLFDALFTDSKSYQLEIHKLNDKYLTDSTGKTVSWNEYYDASRKLRYREEYNFFPSRNVTCVITDKAGQITEVKVWRDIGKLTHKEFSLDILEEYKKLSKHVKPRK